MSEILKTSEEWQKIYPEPMVYDPDGWDRNNYDYSWKEELISLSEYINRLHQSTCMHNVSKMTTSEFYPFSGLSRGDSPEEYRCVLIELRDDILNKNKLNQYQKLIINLLDRQGGLMIRRSDNDISLLHKEVFWDRL